MVYKDDISGLMLPKFHDTSLVLAPEELLKLIRCQCKAMEGRSTHKKCSCSEANVPCTKFCGCYFDGKNCERQVQHQTAADSEDSDQDPDATADQFTDILSSSDEGMTSNRDFELIDLKNINFISRMIQI